MNLGVPRRRPARPVPEAPIRTLAAGAEGLAKAWLVAVIEERPLEQAAAVASGRWASEGPGLCAAALRALGFDEALTELRADRPALAAPATLDALRAVLWSALRSAWPEGEADQVWDLGERLALVIEALREAEPSETPWPQALQESIGAGESPAVVLAELIDYDRLLAIESPEDCATVVARFREAAGVAIGDAGRVVVDGEARVWAIVPGADHARAHALGAAVGEAVRAAPPWRGAPLVAAVGVAVAGADAADAEGLIDAAELAMFSSAAGGPP